MKSISFSYIILFVSMYAAGAIAESTRIQLVADIPIADAPTITTPAQRRVQAPLTLTLKWVAQAGPILPPTGT